MMKTNTERKSIFHKINKTYSIPGQRKLDFLLHRLSRIEKTLLTLLVIVFIASTIGMLLRLNNYILIEVPVQGGHIVEGVIGIPRSINPLLASSASDQDLSALVYSGLMRASTNNTLIPDLAESYEISEDGTAYTFVLKEGLTWHDGESITSDDIIFTIQKVQDSIIRSVKRSNWDGVGVERIDDRTIRFILEQSYSPFLKNTTLGILPKHLWDDIDSEFFEYSQLNNTPVGSGPYTVQNIKRDGEGIPIYYDLQAFDNFALGAPYITKVRVRFYPNELALTDALISGEIMNINSISPEEVSLFEETNTIYKTPLPRVFGVFFNQNESQQFSDRTVRKALNIAVDREYITDTVLSGFGTPITGPIPPGSFGYTEEDEQSITAEQRIEEANTLLEENGWTKDDDGIRSKKLDGKLQKLDFTISTSDTQELMQTANILADTWRKLGALVEIKVFEQGDLEHHVIRPRKYDVLLFGEIIGRDTDLYAFWHSSQRLDPGLNIALYTNITVDKALEEARETTNVEERLTKYKIIKDEIATDIPATFLYSPEFMYITDSKIQAIELQSVTNPSERFLNIHEWFINTDTIWSIFTNTLKQ